MERGGKEGHDRRKLRNQPTVFSVFRISRANPSQNSKALFWPLCVSQYFWVWDLVVQTIVLHCGTWLAMGGMSRAPFSVPPHVTSSSHFQIFLFFRPTNTGSSGHSTKVLHSPFRTVRTPVLLGMLSCTPVPFCLSACLTWSPLLSHVFLTLTFVFLSPLTHQHLF